MADAAVAALAALAATSATHEYCLGVYGPGVFYMVCADAAAARAYAAAPVIDGHVTYKAEGDEEATGELAVGMLTMHKTACIAVVDIPTERTRATVRYGGGSDPFVQHMTLVAHETRVTALPAPVPDDDPMCVAATALITAKLVDAPVRRCAFYVDVRAGTLDVDECIGEDEFAESIAALRVVAAGGDMSGSLKDLEQLFATHSYETHVVAWLKFTDEIDVVWLVPRPVTSSTPPPTDKA